jgi:hypothetical protein
MGNAMPPDNASERFVRYGGPRLAAVASLALVACACASLPADTRLNGLWELRIRDLGRHEVSVATIRFTDDPARSGIAGGKWKRIIVESASATDDKFFPLSDHLSYTVGRRELVIGRNEVCDAYLRLRGELEGGKVHGPYTVFGIHDGEVLGDFSLTRLK